MSVVKTKKYTYIDSLRGYAVLMVLCTHIYSHACHRAKDIALGDFWIQCRMGVMLFFMISALTLFLSLGQKTKNENSPIRNFFLRRFFRIAPLFYIISFYYLIFNQYNNPMKIWGSFTFTFGLMPSRMGGLFGVAWTIGVEMLFYLMVPLLFKYITSLPKALFFFCISLIFSILTKYLLFKYLHGYYDENTLIGYNYYWLPAQLPVFSIGIILYFTLFKSGLDSESEQTFKKYIGCFLMLLGIYFTLTISYSSKLFITENIAFSFALMLFILGMALNTGSVFNNKLMQFLGKISYSFYFVHAIVIENLVNFGFIARYKFSGPITFIIYFVVALLSASLISYISYLIIEKPFQKLGVRLIEKLEARKTLSNI